MDKHAIKEVISGGIYDALKKAGVKVCKYYLVWLIIIMSFNWYQGEYEKDSTDGIDRSNMELHVDALTGCHYLSTVGGMTPRLSIDGHYGCKLQNRNNQTR